MRQLNQRDRRQRNPANEPGFFIVEKPMRRRSAVVILSFYERILGRLRFPLGLAVILSAAILHRVTTFGYLRKCRSERTSCSEQTYVLPGLEGLDFPVGHSSLGSRIYESVRRGVLWFHGVANI